MKRLRSLDVIRGIAILLVVITHYIPRNDTTPTIILQLTSLFWSGVDLFFVLSGFLIAGVLLKNKDTKNYYSVFYIRRSTRILPLYFTLIAFFALVLYVNPKSLRNSLANHFPLWTYFAFVQNFFAASWGTFGGKWMGVTWSLAVEEQFYIFLSIIVKILREKYLAYLALLLIILAPLLRYMGDSELAVYVLPLHRADALMLGVLLALAWRRDDTRLFLQKNINIFRVSFLILFVRIVYLSFENINYGNPLGHSWLGFFYVNLILLALMSDEKSLLFNSKIINWIGLRSYGIYLLHRPVMLITRYIFLRFSLPTLGIWQQLALFTFLTFVASELSFRVLEKPFIAWGHKAKYTSKEEIPSLL